MGCIYKGKYIVLMIDVHGRGIVNEFRRSNPLTFFETELHNKLDEGFFKEFHIVKVSLHRKQLMRQ